VLVFYLAACLLFHAFGSSAQVLPEFAYRDVAVLCEAGGWETRRRRGRLWLLPGIEPALAANR